MNSVLKQLITVLDEKDIEVEDIKTEQENGEMIITVNDKVNLIIYNTTLNGKLGKSYSVVSQDFGKIKNYKSQTAAMEDLTNRLSINFSPGTILTQPHSSERFRVIKHGLNNLYNLQNTESYKLEFICCLEYSQLRELIKRGVYTK